MKRIIPAAMLFALSAPALSSQAAAADVVPSISQRFAAADVKETPDFRAHVVPLIGKLGCNGRACHGSFQGAGGLRLSLFGYDFKMDHEAFTTGDNPRVDKEAPAESLMLEKPLLAVPHKGGKRMEVGSWQHKVFLRWIEEGAKGVAKDDDRTATLDVTPKEIIFNKNGSTTQLKVLAKWSNGLVEDVTALCRFQTNDEQVCKIDVDGKITGGEPGDTHVVVFYDNSVVPIPVMRPLSQFVGNKYPKVPTPTEIDKHVVTKLSKMGIVQSDLSGDAEFLRRVSLDLTGTLPAPKEIESFVADKSNDKRAKKIEELLERPSYAAWWTTLLCDYTVNGGRFNNNQQVPGSNPSQEWYDWIYKRVASNVSYDKVMEGIVTAVSREPEESYADYTKNVSELYKKGSDKSFADRTSMPHYWARQNFRTPQERALGFAYSFLGIRIQCAECHKHPFDQWTQDDFKQFTGFFTKLNYGPNPAAKKEYDQMMADLGLGARANNQERTAAVRKALADGKSIPLQELYVTAAANNGGRGGANRGGLPAAKGRLLGGAEVDLSKYDDPRVALMDWMRDKDNPYFARAFVNRVWSVYFNVGIVQPADDLSLANPPSNKPLLDYLAQGFIDHNFDMKWLHREIVSSRTYQLSWQSNDTNKLDERNFSHAVPRRLPAEVAVDAVKQATAGDAENLAWQTEIKGRKIAYPSAVGGGGNNNQNEFALIVFGKSTRESNCDCDRSMEASLLQTVFLHNDRELLDAVERKGGWADQVVRGNVKSTPEADRRRAKEGDSGELERQFKSAEARLEQLKKKGDEKAAQELEKRIAEYKARFAKDAKDAKPAAEGAKPQAPMMADAESVIKDAYLRTLSRLPTDEELGKSKAFINTCETADEAARGLIWALINTKEFIVNH